MTSWLAIVNEAAGGRGSTSGRAHAALAAVDVAYDLIAPADRAAAREVVREGVADGRRHFIAVGGDGTVNALVNDLLEHPWEKPPVVGVLPAGTGCDLIRTFGIPQRMPEAAIHLVRPGEYLIDVGLAEGSWGRRYFVNVGQAGVAAAAARRATRLPVSLGRIRYPLGLALTLPGFRRGHVEVETGKRNFSGEALAVIFANGQFFGGGFNIAPKATLIDGVLDVQIITARKRRAASLVPRIYRGMHLTDPDVRRYSSAAITVTTREPWPVEVDGEFVGNTPVRVGVTPGRIALKI